MKSETAMTDIVTMDDSPEAVARDVAAVGRLNSVPSLLRVVCEHTAMGFAAVARVTEGSWTACAVRDEIKFGLKPGDQLAVNTTLCMEARAARRPIVFDHASEDAVYRHHHTPRIYNIESYISVPIVLPNGRYFGNLCAIDPKPKHVSDSRTVTMFELFAELIAFQIDSEERQDATNSALLDERETGELREQFIAVLGHDLRSPLYTVGVAAEILVTRTGEPEMVKLGERLRSSTRRMARLIDDVLDFARTRLGSGLGAVMAETKDLATALGEVVIELREAHQGRVVVENIAFSGTAYCDRGRVQQLLSNLLGNALTHGGSEQPVVVDISRQGDKLIVAVTNGGTPIAPENLKKVFDPYWRPSSIAQSGGLGLGLHICSQIVKAHGGTIEVGSSTEAGTRFVATIPIQSRSA